MLHLSFGRGYNSIGLYDTTFATLRQHRTKTALRMPLLVRCIVRYAALARCILAVCRFGTLHPCSVLCCGYCDILSHYAWLRRLWHPCHRLCAHLACIFGVERKLNTVILRQSSLKYVSIPASFWYNPGGDTRLTKKSDCAIRTQSLCGIVLNNGASPLLKSNSVYRSLYRKEVFYDTIQL